MALILVAFERQMGAKWVQSGAQNGQNGSQEHQNGATGSTCSALGSIFRKRSLQDSFRQKGSDFFIEFFALVADPSLDTSFG